MKITKSQLRKLILETMITPTNIVAIILDDPEVPEKIKTMIGDGSDIENVKPAIELLAQLVPRYKHMLDKDHNYQDRFERFDSDNLTAAEELRISRETIVKRLQKVLIKGTERFTAIPKVTVVNSQSAGSLYLARLFPNYKSLIEKDLVIAEFDYVVPAEEEAGLDSVNYSHDHAKDIIKKYNTTLPGLEKYNRQRIEKIRGLPVAINLSSYYYRRNGDGAFKIVILFEKSRPLMSV